MLWRLARQGWTLSRASGQKGAAAVSEGLLDRAVLWLCASYTAQVPVLAPPTLY